jgi:uncharacterized membrane protein YdjX (TVP38/TMEM64 family)
MSILRRLPPATLLKMGLAMAGAVVVGYMALNGVDFRARFEAIAEWLRQAGPWVFFAAMAVLPAFGFPIMFFYFWAGPLFASQMTLPGVIAAGLTAVAINSALTFWLANRALRPLVEMLLARTRFKVPQVTPDTEWSVAVLVRVAPAPLCVQGSVLGLAGVRFRNYMIVTMAVQVVEGTGVMIFGKALMHGQRGLALIGFALVVVALAAMRLARSVMKRKNAGTG